MSTRDGDGIRLNRGDHAGHLHSSFAEQKQVLLAFFQQGLENGEHCVYITSDQSPDDWYFEFQAYGVDVQRERRRGALQIVYRDDWRSLSDFSSIGQARKALSFIEKVRASFTGIRIAGDAAWALRPELPVDKLCHWEATANLIYKGEEIRAICQYNLEEHSVAAIHSALRTHTVVIVDGRCVTNPYYEAPRILENEPVLNQSSADPARVEAMLAHLRAAP